MSIVGKRIVASIQAMLLGLAASLLVEFFGSFYGTAGVMTVITIFAGFAYGFGFLLSRFNPQIPEAIISLLASIIPLIFVVLALKSDNSNSLALAMLTAEIAIFVFIGVRVQNSRM